jgi:N-acetyl sugar amidotransferase
MKVCKRCLYNEHHPLYLTFDEHGICSGCRIHEEKDILDWNQRRQRLHCILEDYRCRSKRNYDCIIPVSGARDSYFIVHTVKNVFGMNPLLVTYNKQYNTAVGARNLSNLRIKFNCDIMTLTVNPQVVKNITRSTLRRFGSLYWHCLAGQTVYPVQMAVKLKIPLIVWGAHQGVDQVGMFSHLDEVEMTRKYRKEHDLMGFEAEDLVDDFDNITEADVMPFAYPDNVEVEQVGVRGIYLNNYIRWDSRLQHEQMIEEYGYETCSQNRTFDSYNDVDCWIYSDLHDYLKLLKHGFSKVLDHACREIRLGHLTREDAARLVAAHSFRPIKHLELFLNWLGVTQDALHYVIDQHRNPTFWRRNERWEWEFLPNSPTAAAINCLSLQGREPTSFRQFTLTSPGQSTDRGDCYLLYGKGHA